MFEQLKKLLKQSSVYGIGAVVSPLISFIMLPIYTRYLTPDDYGLLALTGVVSIFMQSVLSLGMSAGIIRIYFVFKDELEKDEVITSSIYFGTATSAIFAIILYLFAPVIAPILFKVDKAETYFIIIVLTFFVTSTSAKFAAAFKSEERAGLYTFFNVSTLVLTLSLNILFVVVLGREVQGILEAGLLSNSLSMLAMIPFVLRYKRISFSFNKVKQVLGFGLPLIPAGIADIVLSLSDRYFLDNYVGLTEVGLYSIGYRIAGMLTIIMKPFNYAWSPYMFSITDRPDAKEIFSKVLVYYIYVSTFVALGLAIFAKEALMIIATPEFYEAYRIVPLILISYILLGTISILVAGIHIMRKSKYVGFIFMFAAIVNLTANYYLIPFLGMWGAAFSTLISYIFLNSGFYLFSQKLYPINYEFDRIFKIIMISILIYLATSFIIISEYLVVNIFFKLFVLLSFPFLLYLLRFYKKEEIEKILEFKSKILVKLKIKKSNEN